MTQIPIRLAFPNNLPLTLLTTAEMMNAHPHAKINVTRSTTRPSEYDYAARRPERDRSRERRPSLESGFRASNTGSRNNSRSQQPRTQSGPARMPARNPDVQCAACGTSGHPVGECRILPRVQGCLEYITAHPLEAQDSMRAYRKSQHPDARRMARDVIKVLRARLQNGTWDEMEDDEDIVDQIASEYSDDNYIAPIFHLRAETQPPQYCQYTEDNDFSVIHPVQLKPVSALMTPRTCIPRPAPVHTAITLPPYDHMEEHQMTVTRVTSS